MSSADEGDSSKLSIRTGRSVSGNTVKLNKKQKGHLFDAVIKMGSVIMSMVGTKEIPPPEV